MEVILLERIDKLGQMGDVVNVKSGYARNFLLPQKKALRATDPNKQHFEADRAQLEASNLERRTDAEKLGNKMDGLSVTMLRQAGEAGQLYGSVNARDIANGVTEAGFTVSRQQIELAHPIKNLGLFDVKVTLHPEVQITVVANVARSEAEAKTQAKTGKAVVSTDGEEAQPAQAQAETAETEDEAKPKTKKKPAEIGEEEAKVVEEAADEAAAEQAEEIFEEGAAPQPEPEDAAADKAADDAGDKTE